MARSTTVNGARCKVNYESWELNILGVYDVATRPYRGGLRHWFEFIEHAGHLQGDFLEFGVYRGRSLIATALLLQARESSSVAVGFDTFTGFPSVSHFDLQERFDELYETRRISSQHFQRILRNRTHLEWLGRDSHPSLSSTSGNFSNTSEEYVRQLCAYTRTESQIEIFAGDFAACLDQAANSNRTVAGALIDCDLWGGYQVALDYVWPRLCEGGMIFLDEYYSLKFPGPRFAVDSFCERMDVQPTLLEDEGSWERWAIYK